MEELVFVGVYIYVYFYLFDKKSVEIFKDIKIMFIIQMLDEDNISMNMWMKGVFECKVFLVLSLMIEGLSWILDMFYVIKE